MKVLSIRQFSSVLGPSFLLLGMELAPKAAAIVNTIAALGKTLVLTLTVEGVETAAQARVLAESGCDQAQGCFFGWPISAISADALINAESSISEVRNPDSTEFACPMLFPEGP